jgi:hypothetical protein
MAVGRHAEAQWRGVVEGRGGQVALESVVHPEQELQQRQHGARLRSRAARSELQRVTPFGIPVVPEE